MIKFNYFLSECTHSPNKLRDISGNTNIGNTQNLKLNDSTMIYPKHMCR